MKIGFIGCGNMAGAMIGGIIKSGCVKPEEIIGSNATQKGRERTKETYGIEIAKNNVQVAMESDVVFLSVKPQFYEQVIEEISSSIKEEQIIVAIAPGKTLEWLEEKFGKKVKLVRSMPNTPALVGEGMTAVCVNEQVSEKELEMVCRIMESFGKVEVIPERLMDAVVAVSGSSPAYIFMFIEAMADAAVMCGMPRMQAYKFAAQAVLGSAKMVLETGMHPGELKDMVCSPAGTTIQAVRKLEEKGLRSAVIEAMKTCADVSKGM